MAGVTPVQPTAQNTFILAAMRTLVAPCSTATVINQGTRVKLASNLITPTIVATEDWCGVANFSNPPTALGQAVSQGEILIKDNIVTFDAPVAEAFAYGAPVYAYDDGTYHYSGAVTASSAGSAKKVGTYVGAGQTGGVNVRVAVKILPTQIL